MAVESAIVLPMFVFLILGILQLGLMHQARLMTKYAAYRAARAGSLNNADRSKMKDAAIAALLPLLARGDAVTKSAGATDFAIKYQIHRTALQGKLADFPMMDNVVVNTCGPLQKQLAGKAEIDFDDPAVAFPQEWAKSRITQLKVQVLFNYQLIIPFANATIYAIYTNLATSPLLHLGKDGKDFGGPKHLPYVLAGQAGTYVIPIRASYAMRMQSNPYKDQLPTSSSACKFSFRY
ncbi:MAG: pilus assembly protein [Myxococcaceae bacterium]|nr:pilus assembly protein [Myxococcaceae bacterium]